MKANAALGGPPGMKAGEIIETNPTLDRARQNDSIAAHGERRWDDRDATAPCGVFYIQG
jgi:hypothetical protein